MNTPGLTMPENMSPEEYKKFIEEYNQELEEAEAEYQRGEYIGHEEMKSQIKDWFNKTSKNGGTVSG
jgi:hypothetical protein